MKRVPANWSGAAVLALPASGQLPVQLDQPIAFTPATVGCHVEGGGPIDPFRFAGDFTATQVPEPAVITLVGTAGVLGLLYQRFRGTVALPRDHGLEVSIWRCRL